MAPVHHRKPDQARHATQREEPISFGAWLRQRRRALDLTQAELAQRVGCARITIRRIEADELKPSKALAELLAQELGVTDPQHAAWLHFARGIEVPAIPATTPTVVASTTPAEQTPDRQAVQPTALQSRLPPQAEIRLATVLCVGLERPLPPLTPYTPEIMAHKLNWLLQCLETIAQPYAAHFAHLLSNGVTLLFGLEQSHEDDPERALRVALALRQRAQEVGIAVSSGINMGPVYWGPVASSLVTPIAAVGPTVTLAETLQSQAAPGQILVSESAYQQTRANFLFIPQTLALPNTAVLPAYRVTDWLPHRRPMDDCVQRHTSLIGRQTEMSKLTAALATLTQGQGQLVLISGEAGIGKSRLIAELKAHADQQKSPILWLEGRCQALGMRTAYWPVLELLRIYFASRQQPEHAATGLAAQVMTQLDHLTLNGALTLAQKEEIGPLLGNLLAVHFGHAWDEQLTQAVPGQLRHRTAIALRDLLVALAQQQPVALCLEDLQWSDELSLHLITLLMEALRQAPLLVICSYRPDAKQVVTHLPTLALRQCPEQVVELQLRELRPSQSRALVAELLTDAPIDPALQQLLLEKAQGNPLFLEELTYTLLDAGLLEQGDGSWRLREQPATLGVPLTVQGVILSRVDRLQPAARQMLQRAAVLGPLFSHRLLAQLVPTGLDLASALEILLTTAFIYQTSGVPEIVYAFKHVLVQEAVYQTLLPTQQAQLHQHAAEALEQLHAPNLAEVYELLVYHYERSPSENRTVERKKIEYSLKAGEKARHAYLNEPAIAYFQRALTMLKTSPLTLPSLFATEEQQLAGIVGLGKAYLAASKLDEAEAAFRQALSLGEQLTVAPSQLIRLYYWLGETLYWQNRHLERLAIGQAGLARLGSAQATAEAALMNDTIAWSYWCLGQTQSAIVFALRNTALLPALPYSEELGGVYMHVAYIILRGQHEIDEGQRWVNLVQSKAAQAYDLRALARTAFFTGAELAENMGDLVTATTKMEQAIHGFAKIGDAKQETSTLSRLAWILLRRGHLQNAELYLRQAEEKERALGGIGAIGIGHANLGLLHLCRHEWDAVEANLRLSAAVGQSNNFPAMHLVWTNFLRGHLYLLQNRRQAAQQQLEATMIILAAVEIQGLPEAGAANYMRLLSTLEKAWDDVDRLHTYAQLIQQKDSTELDARFVQPYLQPQGIDTTFSLPTFCFSHNADDQDEAKFADTEWHWCDPLGDCAYQVANGVTIRAANGRDLYRHNRSAPRLLQVASGDFAAQTICSPATAEQPAIGGLLLWRDDRHYLHLSKGLLGPDEISFRGCLANQTVVIGRGHLPTTRVFLRLERQSSWIYALCSADGNQWFTAGQVAFPVEDPLQIGLYAIGDIDRWFYPGTYCDGTAIYFEEFSLYQRKHIVSKVG